MRLRPNMGLSPFIDRVLCFLFESRRQGFADPWTRDRRSMESRPSENRRGAEVVVSDPDGAVLASVDLSGTLATVGRLSDLNDIALQPDPELLVTRAGHCTLERVGAHWFVVDGGSVNGTFPPARPRRLATAHRAHGSPRRRLSSVCSPPSPTRATGASSSSSMVSSSPCRVRRRSTLAGRTFPVDPGDPE